MPSLDAAAVQARLGTVPGWALKDGALVRTFTFAGFPEAIAFIVRIGFAAEAADHHPDFLVSYKKVTLTFVTHSAGGLTEKDFDGAVAAGKTATAAGAA